MIGCDWHDRNILLRDHGIECQVLSPAHLPKTPNSAKQKTDAKDAQRHRYSWTRKDDTYERKKHNEWRLQLPGL